MTDTCPLCGHRTAIVEVSVKVDGDWTVRDFVRCQRQAETGEWCSWAEVVQPERPFFVVKMGEDDIP